MYFKRVKLGFLSIFRWARGRNDTICHVGVSWPSSVLLDYGKWVKFEVSGYFLGDTWKEWPVSRHAGVPWGLIQYTDGILSV